MFDARSGTAPWLAPDLAALRREHAAQARPDLARVHPSWCLRGLQEESAAVQRAVLAGVPEQGRAHLQEGLNLRTEDMRPDQPPHPEALAWARALWTERLVGDLPERPDDPPAVRALTRLRPRELLRLVHATGLAKGALAPVPPRGRQGARFAHFQERLADADARLRELARRDVAAVGATPRHARARLGLITFARLLSVADPYRVRWALQHLPYLVAKQTRSLMPATAGRVSVWIAWETTILRAAWERLGEEGRLATEWEDVP